MPRSWGGGSTSTGDISPTIEGLKIYRGDADGLSGDPWFDADAGGGIYVVTATATINNNLIVSNGNNTYFGGGIYVNKADSIISNNIIRNNSAFFGGGMGIWYSDALVDGNEILFNSHSGVFLYGYTPTFRNNIVKSNYSDQDGGGFSLYYGGAVFEGNTISFNDADSDGGGVSLSTYSSASFVDNKIVGNSAGNVGGTGGGVDLSLA